MDTSFIFKKMASEILANSLENLDPNSFSLGQQLYESFVSRLLEKCGCLKETESKIVKVFYKNERNILSIQIQSAAIKLTLCAKVGTLKDDKKLLRDVSKIGHWGYGDYQVKLEDEAYFDDVIELIGQIY